MVPMLESFDYTSTAESLGVRPVTTVAPQALTLLNSRFMREQAAAFADRVIREAGSDEEAQIERAFRLALANGERILVATRETGLLLEYDFAGELLSEREDSEAYERIGPDHELGFTAPSGTQYLIEDGRVLRATSERQTVIVNGFASHEAITYRMVAMGLCLFFGVLMLIGGFVTTGRPRSAD